jgi:short-subunit dehydrogenase
MTDDPTPRDGRTRAAARNIVITGASSGLGAGLARSYAAPGITLGLIGRDADRLEATAAACRARGATVETGLFDVGVAEPLGAWLLDFDARAPLDLVAACAGVSAGTMPDGRNEGVGLAALQVRTNLLGVMHVIEPLLPRLMGRRAGQIAMVSSVAGLRGLPWSPGYSASKAGVRAYGEGLRALLRHSNISVSVVVPGFFDTPMTDRFKGDKPFLISLDRAVGYMRRGVDRRKSRVTFPWILALGLRLTDLMPAAIGDRILYGVRFHIVPGR